MLARTSANATSNKQTASEAAVAPSDYPIQMQCSTRRTASVNERPKPQEHMADTETCESQIANSTNESDTTHKGLATPTDLNVFVTFPTAAHPEKANMDPQSTNAFMWAKHLLPTTSVEITPLRVMLTEEAAHKSTHRKCLHSWNDCHRESVLDLCCGVHFCRAICALEIAACCITRPQLHSSRLLLSTKFPRPSKCCSEAERGGEAVFPTDGTSKLQCSQI